jgi:hypothetical protein
MRQLLAATIAIAQTIAPISVPIAAFLSAVTRAFSAAALRIEAACHGGRAWSGHLGSYARRVRAHVFATQRCRAGVIAVLSGAVDIASITH